MAGTLTTAWTSARQALGRTALTPFDGVAVMLLTGVLTVEHGVGGLLAGGAVLGAAAVWAGPAGFVLAQLIIVALAPARITWTLPGTQFAAFLLLASGVVGWPPQWRQLGELTLAYVGVLVLVWLLHVTFRWVWQSALVLLVCGGAIAYVLYRYEQVVVRLVTTSQEGG